MQFISAYPFIEISAQLTETCEFVLVFMLALVLVPAVLFGSRVIGVRLSSPLNPSDACADHAEGIHSTRLEEENIMSDKRSKFLRSKRCGGPGFRSPKKEIVQEIIALEMLETMVIPTVPSPPPITFGALVVLGVFAILGIFSPALAGLAMVPNADRIADMVSSLFGRRANDGLTAITLLDQCDGLWIFNGKTIYLIEGNHYSGKTIAPNIFEVTGEDGETYLVANSKDAMSDEVAKKLFHLPLNINTASEAELLTLSEIGLVEAKQILNAKGEGYKNLQDLNDKAGLNLDSKFELENKGCFSFRKVMPKWHSAAALANASEKEVVGLINKAIVGQEYRQMAVLEIGISNGGNIKATPKKSGSDFRGRALIDQILADCDSWDSSINAVTFVETAKELKDAMSAESLAAERWEQDADVMETWQASLVAADEFEEAKAAYIEKMKADKIHLLSESTEAIIAADSEIAKLWDVKAFCEKAYKAAVATACATPLNDQWERIQHTFSALHNAKSNSPFVFQATDNGFCLVHSVLADLYLQFAEKHVNATQYLKVITGVVLKPAFAKVAIVKDHAIDGKAVGTDGMSFVSQDFLAERQIKSGVGIQFRSLSANVVKAIQAADFSAYCKAYNEAFLNATSGFEMFVKSFELPEVKISVGDLEIHKASPGEHTKVKGVSLVKGAKQLAKELKQFDSFKALSGKEFNRAIIAWYNSMTNKLKLKPFVGDTDCKGLFAKGAAIPMLDVDQSLSSGTNQSISAKGVDMITPVANFKALGKEYLASAKKAMKADCSVVLIVEMYVAPISIKNGGNMRITPQVSEPAGTAISSEMTEHSLFTYCEAYDELLADGAFKEDWAAINEALKDYKGSRKISFEYEGVTRIEPWAMSLWAASEVIEEFEAEEFQIHGMPNADYAFIDPAQRSDALTSMSKKMTDRMIGGPKRQACNFVLMMMAEFVPYGEVAVPVWMAKRYRDVAVLCKQPIQSGANTQRVKVVSLEKYAEELFKLGLITKAKNGSWIGLDKLNIMLINTEQAEDECYADDDGDDASLVPVDEEDPPLFQVANVLVLPVKVKSVAINAAELSPMSTNSPEKNKGWRDSSSEKSMGYNYVGGSYIGLFVNMQSLFKTLGSRIRVPALLMPFMAEFADHISLALQFYAEYEGQNELDDAKKTKIMVLFLLVCCCMEKRFHVDMQRSDWTGSSVLTEEEFASSGLPMKWIRKTENVMDEDSLTQLLEAWETKILNGEEWKHWDLDLTTGKLRLNAFGKAFLNGKTTVRVYNPQFAHEWVQNNVAPDSEEAFDEWAELNMLWMPRRVWESQCGDTIEYIKEFTAIWMPDALHLGLPFTTQHNWVTYYRTGWRFVSKSSLAGRKVASELKGKKVWVYIPSPLLPAVDSKGAFIPYFNPLRAKALNIPGFVNIPGKSTVLPGWFYTGENTVNAMRHEMWLMALWRKWEAVSGIPMFENVIGQKDGENFLKFMTPGEILRKISTIKKNNGSYELPWYLVTGQVTSDIQLADGRIVEGSDLMVHTSLFGLKDSSEMKTHFLKLMSSWFRSFGLDPAVAKDADQTVYTVETVKFMLQQLKDKSETAFFASPEEQFWNQHSSDDEDVNKSLRSLKAALFFNAMAHADLSEDDWFTLFEALGNRKIFEDNKKAANANLCTLAEGSLSHIVRVCRYDMLELVAIQAPDCEFTLAMNAVPWEKFSADQTQMVAIKAHTLHSHYTGMKLQECPGCSAKLKLELKRLGRGEKAEATRKHATAAAAWLNYVMLAHNTPLCFVGFNDMDSVQAGKSLFPQDIKDAKWAWFYSEFTTSLKSFDFAEKGGKVVEVVKRDKRDEYDGVMMNRKNAGIPASVIYPAGADLQAWLDSNVDRKQAHNQHGKNFIYAVPLFERLVETKTFGKGNAKWRVIPQEKLNFFGESQPEPKPPGTKINIGDTIVEDSAPSVTAPPSEQPAEELPFEYSDFPPVGLIEDNFYGDGFVDHAPLFDLPFENNEGEYEVVEDQPSLILGQPEEEAFNSAFFLGEIPEEFQTEDSQEKVEVDTLTGKTSTPSAPAPQVIEACEGWILHPEEVAAGSEIYPCVGRRAKVVAEEDYFLFPFMVDGKKQLLEVIKQAPENEA